MRVFVTGATGFIGQVVVQELLSAGHQVLGLARSDKGAESLAALGVEVHRGSLDDLDSLKRGASASDGVVHLAFIHDFSDYEGNCRVDRLAIETMGAALAGSNRPLIITSGTLLLPQGRQVTEEDTPDLTAAAAARGASELLALSLVSQGVRPSVVRLPPTNHGDGDHGFIPQLIAIAREKGRVRVYWRWTQSLARNAPIRRRPCLPAGFGQGQRRLHVSCSGRGGCVHQRHSSNHWQAAERTCCQQNKGRSPAAFRLARICSCG
jgi:nucleoside-diphosphate-sugar epimerase